MENINNKLKHLTDKQIEELMDRYYEGEKTTDLIKLFNLDTKPGQLYTLFPPMECKDKVCPNCNVKLIKKRESRSANSSNNNPYCPICHHVENGYCECPSCTEKRRQASLEDEKRKRQELLFKRKLILETYSLENLNPINIRDLNFRDKVYLGALLRHSLSVDYSTINPLDKAEGRLAPTNTYTSGILDSLTSKQIIAVDPSSSIDAFTNGEGSPFPHTYYIFLVNYYLNISQKKRTDIINDLINPPKLSDKFIEINNEHIHSLWKDIALAECLEYLVFQMHNVKFEFIPGPKTIALFNDLLDNFSVSQIYGLIFKSIANATKYYQESNISRKQAANSVIGACQRLAEKACINNWDVTKYTRVKECRQTVISEFYFNRLLNIGNLGFDLPPQEINYKIYPYIK